MFAGPADAYTGGNLGGGGKSERLFEVLASVCERVHIIVSASVEYVCID